MADILTPNFINKETVGRLDLEVPTTKNTVCPHYEAKNVRELNGIGDLIGLLTPFCMKILRLS